MIYIQLWFKYTLSKRISNHFLFETYKNQPYAYLERSWRCPLLQIKGLNVWDTNPHLLDINFNWLILCELKRPRAYLSKLRRPPLRAISWTSLKVPASWCPNMRAITQQNTITQTWKASLNTVAFMPPWVSEQEIQDVLRRKRERMKPSNNMIGIQKKVL